MRVGSGEVHGVFVHGSAAMPDVKARIRRIGVVPDGIRRARIERPNVVRSGHVQDAVEEDWRGFYFRGLPGLERPS